MAVTVPSTLKERIAALQQRGSSPQPISPPRSRTPSGSPKVTGGLRDKIARFEEKGGTPIPRGSFGLGAPPKRAGKPNNELWGNRLSSAGRVASGSNSSSLGRSTTVSVNPLGRVRCASTSDVQLGGSQLLHRELGALSARQSVVPEEGGTRTSEMINSLDIATGTLDSPSFVNRAFSQSSNQAPCLPAESTIATCEPEQTIVGVRMAIHGMPSVLVSCDADNSDALESVPEDHLATILGDVAEDSVVSNPKDALLKDDGTETHITVTVAEHLTPPAPATNESSIPKIVGQDVFHSHSPHLSDTSPLEFPMPLEIQSAESVLVQEDDPASSKTGLPEPPTSDLPAPNDILTVSSPSFESLDLADAIGIEKSETDDDFPVLEDESLVFAAVNLPRHLSRMSWSSAAELQAEQPSPPPPMMPHGIASSSETAQSSDTTHNQSPSSMFIPSSTTLDSSVNMTRNLAAVSGSRPPPLTRSSHRPVSATSTSTSEVPWDSLPHVSPILDAFPSVPQYVPSAPGSTQARSIFRHRSLADRSSTSSIKSTPSLSFSFTSSSSTCSPTSSSIAALKTPDSGRPAVMHPTKSCNRPNSYASLYDDSDEGEGGWANVVVTRRFY